MRNRPGTWSNVFCASLVAVLLASCSTSTTGPLPSATYHANNSRTGYSTGATITSVNASHLLQKWHVSVTAPISNQPIVDGGVIYWGDWNGQMHANSLSGDSLWSTG